MTIKNPFDPSGRERYRRVMEQVGYVEMAAFFGRADLAHYCCLSCEYLKEDPNSPTGYICKKYGFPDEPSGCCDGWEPLPELANG